MFSYSFKRVGDKCQDNITAKQVEERDPEDSFTDQLQAGRRAMGSRDTSGKSGQCCYTANQHLHTECM